MSRTTFLLIIGALTIALGAPASAAVVQEPFDAGLDGWTVLGDPAPGSPSWQAAGGNPGGFAQTVDNNNGDEMYWTASPAFTGVAAEALGGTLAFDRITDVLADEASGGDVVLTAQDGTTVKWSAATLDLEPTMAWGTTSVTLAPGPGWTGSSGDAATAKEFGQVLSAIKTIQIAAEYTTQVDTDGLDNVVLTYTPTALPAAAKTITLPPDTKGCASRRSFPIRIRQVKGLTYASASVFVNGKKVKAVKAARLSAPVNLTGLPKGTFIVRITVTTTDGRTISGHRTYHTCVKHRSGSGKGKL